MAAKRSKASGAKSSATKAKNAPKAPKAERRPSAPPKAGRSSTSSKPPKTERNTGKPWSAEDVRTLRELAGENTPTRVIGLKLGRTPTAIYNKAHSEGISLKPVNQSPMG